MYTNNQCTVPIGNNRTEFFPQGRGIKQSCSLGPTLVNIDINELASMLKHPTSPRLNPYDKNVTFLTS